MSRRPRVLVVDDSAFARTVLSRILRGSGVLDVVGTARDGRDALELIETLDPDVITLDLTMPVLDGIGVLRILQARARPRVIVVSMSDIETSLGVEALALGAIDIVAKPTALASDRLYELGAELIAKLVAAAPLGPPLQTGEHAMNTYLSHHVQLVMVGTSTGGPQALTRLLSGLPGNLSAPVAMVLHIPVGYTQALAERLDKLSALNVVEAHEGLELRPGMAVLARAGMQLRIARTGDKLCTQLVTTPVEAFMPSVNHMFLSGAAAVGAGAMGVIMTGMGDDGLIGARAIHAAGGSLLTESSASCVVYGMPRAVDEAKLGATSVSLENLAGEIARRV